MTIVKALIGGLVGAVLATVALMYLRDGSLRGYEWFPIITGLLTGLGAKVLAAGRGGYLSGAIAAAVALLAMFAASNTQISAANSKAKATNKAAASQTVKAPASAHPIAGRLLRPKPQTSTQGMNHYLLFCRL